MFYYYYERSVVQKSRDQLYFLNNIDEKEESMITFCSLVDFIGFEHRICIKYRTPGYFFNTLRAFSRL